MSRFTSLFCSSTKFALATVFTASFVSTAFWNLKSYANSTEDYQTFSAKGLCENLGFELTYSITLEDGKSLVKEPKAVYASSRIFSFGTKNNSTLLPNEVCVIQAMQNHRWENKENKGVAVAQINRISVTKDALIQIKVTELNPEASNESEPKKDDIWNESIFKFRDLTPVVVPTRAKNGKRVLIKIDPKIMSSSAAIDLPSIIAGKNIIVHDNQGRVWAKNLSLEGPARYVGLKMAYGAVALSLTPFAGSRLIGDAKENRITIKKENGGSLTFQSESPYLPAGVKAKVYGIFWDDKKSSGINSVQEKTSSQENEFLESINEW